MYVPTVQAYEVETETLVIHLLNLCFKKIVQWKTKSLFHTKYKTLETFGLRSHIFLVPYVSDILFIITKTKTKQKVLHS